MPNPPTVMARLDRATQYSRAPPVLTGSPGLAFGSPKDDRPGKLARGMGPAPQPGKDPAIQGGKRRKLERRSRLASGSSCQRRLASNRPAPLRLERANWTPAFAGVTETAVIQSGRTVLQVRSPPRKRGSRGVGKPSGFPPARERAVAAVARMNPRTDRGAMRGSGPRRHPGFRCRSIRATLATHATTTSLVRPTAHGADMLLHFGPKVRMLAPSEKKFSRFHPPPPGLAYTLPHPFPRGGVVWTAWAAWGGNGARAGRGPPGACHLAGNGPARPGGLLRHPSGTTTGAPNGG